MAAEMTLLHQAAQKAVEALNHIVRRLQMDIDDGSRPDQWSMEDLVRKAQPAIDAVSSALQQQTEPVAWLVTGGRAYNDRAYIAKDRAELEAVDRRDGSKAVPLYTAPALQHQEEPPPECKTEEEKRAFAFGWWKAMEANRARCTGAYAFGVQEVPREPVAWRYRYSPKQDWKLTSQPTTQWAADHSGFEEEPLYASPSTTRQQEVGSFDEWVAREWPNATDGERDVAWSAWHAAAPSTPEKAGGVSDGVGEADRG